MDARTKENLAIALAAGIITFAVTFATFHYIYPTIRNVVRG